MTWRRLLVFAAVLAVGLGAVHGAVGLGTVINGEEDDPAETPRLVYEGDTLELDAAEGQTVRGQTDLESGEEVTVRLKSSDSSPFLIQNTATVDEDGAFEATFDLSSVEGNQSFEATVLHDDEELLNETGEVHATENDADDGDDEADETVFETDDDGEIELAAEDGQVVRGQTELEPGTEVTVRLRSSGENPFLMQRQVTIGEDGSFEATFDLSDVEPGSPFEARLRADGEAIDTAPGEVTE